jgi:hypothetical protein
MRRRWVGLRERVEGSAGEEGLNGEARRRGDENKIDERNLNLYMIPLVNPGIFSTTPKVQTCFQSYYLSIRLCPSLRQLGVV